MTHPTNRSLFAAAIAASVVLAACAPAAPAPAAPAAPASPAGEATSAPAAPAAKPEKLTVLCTVQETWCQAQTKAFETKTGIKTSFVRLSSGEAVAKLKATKDTPEFSVWWGGPADGHVAAKAEGLTEAYKSPNAADISDTQKDADGFWTGIYVGALGFCSNKDALAKLGVDAPKSWEDLLNPKLKGQVSVAHPATSGTSFTMVWTQVTLRGGTDQALEYMKKLHNNVFQYTKSGVGPVQIVGRGEAAVGVVFSHDCVQGIEEGFSALTVSYPSEGTGYEIGGMSLIKGAPEAEAAKMWIDWSLTTEAQELGPTVKAYQLPTNPNAKVSDKAEKLSAIKLIDYDFAKAGAARKEIAKKFEEDIAPAPKQ